jgi:hypothetical protein
MKDTGRLQDIDYSLKTAVKCGRRIGNMQHHPAASPPQFLGNDHPIEHFCHRFFDKGISPLHLDIPSVLPAFSPCAGTCFFGPLTVGCCESSSGVFYMKPWYLSRTIAV